MDILAHGLWTGLVLTAVAARRPARPFATSLVLPTLVLAVLPDLLHLLPMLAWSLTEGPGWSTVWAYMVAVPGSEPASPAWIRLGTHHLHCIMHSVVMAAVFTALLMLWRRRFWWPLLGWYGHILIDVFTHSADFYPSPLWYPISMRGFDGLAWNEPRWLVANYLLLALCAGVLLWRRRRR